MQSGLQRKQAASLRKSLEIAAILQVSPSNRTGESVQMKSQASFRAFFLWKAIRSPVSRTPSGEGYALTTDDSA
jgi:hypothetical protein